MAHTQKYTASLIATVSILLSFVLWTGFLVSSYATLNLIIPFDQEIYPTGASHSAAVDSKEEEMERWELSEPYTLRIPSVKIKTPVLVPSLTHWDAKEWPLLEEQMQVGLTFGSVAYPHSAEPGSNGALIIAGHSSPPHERAKNSDYGDIFAKLPDIKLGEKIYIEVSGKVVEYRVENIEVLPADETTLLKQTSKEHRLKLITCYPVGTTNERLVVTAKLAHGPR